MKYSFRARRGRADRFRNEGPPPEVGEDDGRRKVAPLEHPATLTSAGRAPGLCDRSSSPDLRREVLARSCLRYTRGMSSDAIAVIPRASVKNAQPWHEAQGVGGGTFTVCHLKGATLVNLGFPVQSGDADLYAALRRYHARLPKRVWVFPDSVMPDEIESVDALIELTKPVGRFIEAGATTPTLLSTLGLPEQVIENFQREVSSGKPARVKRAVEELGLHLQGHDPEQLAQLLEEFLSGKRTPSRGKS